MPSGIEVALAELAGALVGARVVRADGAFALQRLEVARHVGGADARAGAVALRRPLVEIDALDGRAAVDQPPHAGALDVEHAATPSR